MADGIFFQNQNAVFDKLKKQLENAATEIVTEVDAEMNASINEMATNAKKLALKSGSNSKLTGELSRNINVKKDSLLQYRLRAEKRYAAYVEFGTGPYAKSYTATIDDEWKEYALEFKTTKPGHTPAKPFIYPSVQKIFPLMIQRIKKIIEF